MSVKVSWEDNEEELKLREDDRVRDIFDKIDVNPETVIVEKDEEVVSLEEKLEGDDKIRLINVVSGG
ncbi:MAG: MoaD/ThiS family protein [Candidatus Aenigmatarchaeota archaeon]